MGSEMHDVPLLEESAEALVFIGLEPDTAKEIFDRWSGRHIPNDCPDSLMDYVDTHAGYVSSVHLGFRDMDHRKAMSRLGVSKDLQDAILDPRFDQIFRTESRTYWLRDTLHNNHRALQQLLQRQYQRQETARASNHGSNFSTTNASRNSRASEDRTTRIAFTANISPADPEISVKYSTVESEAPVPPTHTALYRGQTYASLPWDSYFTPEGKFEPRVLRNHWGCFEEMRTAGCQFTTDKNIAEQYRQYAARRCPWSETWLLCIRIPKYFLLSLEQASYYHGTRTWEAYVWHLKQGRTPGDINRLRRLELVKTHLSTADPVEVARLQLGEFRASPLPDQVLWNEDTRKNVVRYVFLQWSTNDAVARFMSGTTHIEITRASRRPGWDGDDDSTNQIERDWELVGAESESQSLLSWALCRMLNIS